MSEFQHLLSSQQGSGNSLNISNNYGLQSDLESNDNTFEVTKSHQDKLDTILDQIGMGKFQYLLFILCGFGWLADNMWLQGVIVILPRIQRHFSISDLYIGLPDSSFFIGMMLSSIFWGGHSDLHGRRDAFHWTLSIATFAGIFSAIAPNFWSLNLFLIVLGFGIGGTVPVDSSILLEFLPSKHHYLVTSLSMFFGLGAVLASLFAYLILPTYSCPELIPGNPLNACDVAVSNNGWRYVLVLLSVINGLMAFWRVFLFKLPETPQYLLANNQPEEVVDTLNYIAKYNGLSMKFTMSDLIPADKPSQSDELCNQFSQNQSENINNSDPDSNSSSKFTLIESGVRTPWILNILGFDLNLIYNLFQPYYRLSTILIWSIWMLMATAYSLFMTLLPKYLEMKGQTDEGPGTMADVYWSYLIYSVCGIPGSLMGGWLVDTSLGRKGTLALSTALAGLAQIGFIFFKSLNLATFCSSSVSFLVTLMYSVLYSYTPEVFDPRLRSTACGIAASLSRVLAIISPMIAGFLYSIDAWSPLEMSTIIIFVLAILSVLLPIETKQKPIDSPHYRFNLSAIDWLLFFL